MINVCLFGSFIFFPIVLLLHLTRLEPIYLNHFYSLTTILTLICVLRKIKRQINNKIFFPFCHLVFNILITSIPFQYTSYANRASFLIIIPLITCKFYFLFFFYIINRIKLI